MKITGEQIKQMNSKCKNGWVIDTPYLINYGEKVLKKRITIDEKSYLQFILNYNSKNQINIRVSKYQLESGMYQSEGGGKQQILDETSHPRKNVNKLIEYTSKLDNDECMKIKDTAKIVEVIGMIPSEDF